MKKTVLFLLLLNLQNLQAQNYAAILIPDSLRNNANAVLRFNHTIVLIKSPSKAIVKSKYVYTILNEAGASHAQYLSYYSKINTIEKLEGYLYDALGKEIKSTKKRDFIDFSANDAISLVTDGRYKKHNFYYATYPYTIAYEEEVAYEGIFFLPSWQPVEPNCSVQQSSFSVQAPSDYVVRYKQFAYDHTPIINTDGSNKVYNWQIENYIAKKYEIYQPIWQTLHPSVLLAPSEFEIEGYKGEMNSWLKLGQFINILNTDKQQLPNNVKTDVHNLIDKITDIKQKVKILYEYLQKNTRYISIQLGIGSWQPYDATYVATNKYGDCKALANYMISLLKEANIKGNYVLIKAGSNDNGLWEDFASNNFNHAIACVPLENDTIWLECTSQTKSAGYLGSFTGNRKALLINEKGGFVVTTPNYMANDNTQIRKIEASINQNGDLFAKINTKYSGLQQDDLHNLIHGTTLQEKQNYLNTVLSIPTYNVLKFNYSEIKGRLPILEEALEINAPFYATITGKRLFISPNIFNNNTYKFQSGDDRQNDIVFKEAYIDIDSAIIIIPDNYIVEAMPKNVILDSKYGKYSISFTVSNNAVQIIRKSERQQNIFPKIQYNAISTFLAEIFNADKSRVVLVKKD